MEEARQVVRVRGEGGGNQAPPHANAPLSWLKSFRSTHTVGFDRQRTYYSPYERETSLHCGVSRAFGGQEAGLSLLAGSRQFGQAQSLDNNNSRQGVGGPGVGGGNAPVGWSRKFTCDAPLLRPDSGAETLKPCCNRLATRAPLAQNGDGLALQSFRVEESPEKATSFRIKGIGRNELVGGETGGAGGDGREGTSSTHPSPPSGVRKGFTLRPVGTRADPDEGAPGGVDEIVQISDRDALPPEAAESDKGQRADRPSRLERIYNKICSHPVYKFFSEGKSGSHLSIYLAIYLSLIHRSIYLDSLYLSFYLFLFSPSLYVPLILFSIYLYVSIYLSVFQSRKPIDLSTSLYR